MTKVEDMMSKIEVERIMHCHALRNSSKNKEKINNEKLKVSNYWQKVPESSLVSVLFAKVTKKMSMFLKKYRAEKSSTLANLVVYRYHKRQSKIV